MLSIFFVFSIFIFFQKDEIFVQENISNFEKWFQVDRYGNVSFDAKKNVSDKSFQKDFYEYLWDRDYKSFSILHAEFVWGEFFSQLSQYRPVRLFLSYWEFSQKNNTDLQNLSKIDSLVDLTFQFEKNVNWESYDDFFLAMKESFSKKQKMGTLNIDFLSQNYKISQKAFPAYSQLPFSHFTSNMSFDNISENQMLEFLENEKIEMFQHLQMQYEKNIKWEVIQYWENWSAIINWERYKQNLEWEYQKIK